ncbi:GtrA family protein [Ornithinimicrobium flavum]|uniref:GtrA family protein n=1 Tax=Ornithinimicrobium flavum TaxID=1288636 RepID=UPI00106FCD8D|nr:GtrA family protein [Ornithinimicrobium flavum]
MTSPRPGLVDRLRAGYQVLVQELAKFGTVGALAFVLDTVLYNLLVFGLPGADPGPMADSPLWAKTVSAGVATVFSWLGNRWWTFRHRRSEGVPREFVLFVFFNVVGLGIALACLGFSRYVLGLDSQLADNISGNGIGLALGTLFRFWAYRTFVFRGELAAEARGSGDDVPAAGSPSTAPTPGPAAGQDVSASGR